MTYSDNQNQLLKALYPDKQIDESALTNQYHLSNAAIRQLLVDKIICYASADFKESLLCLSEIGRAYVEKINEENTNSKRNRIRDDINLLLAVIGIIIGIIALFR